MAKFTNLDISILRSFVKGIELGSFARASSAVGRSQAALSGQMRKLEGQVGEALFKKSGRGLTLTPAGETLLSYSRKILALNDDALNAITNTRLDGIVKIGLAADFAENWLPRLLGEFVRCYPMVQIQVSVSRSAELVDHVLAGHLDLALVWGDPGDNPHGRKIGSVPMGWIAGKGASIPVDFGGTLPIIAFDEPCIFRRLALGALDADDLSWRISFVSPSLPSLWSAVDAGLGVTARTAISLPSRLSFLEPKAAGLPLLPNVPLSLYQSTTQLAAAASMLTELIVDNLTTSHSFLMTVDDRT